MGCWGMGITQSDEYCDVYDRFMEDYDEGKPVADITKDILDEYLEEFEADDGVLHDVYFALGKAEWMCGGVSSEIFERLYEIIESRKNIEFLRELDATEKDLKLREKNLQKYIANLSIPREKIRKRKTPPENYTPQPNPDPIPLPPMKIGELFAYHNNGKYRIFTPVAISKIYLRRMAFCYSWKRDFDEIPTIEMLMHEHIVPIGWFSGKSFPDINNLVRIGNLMLPRDLAECPGLI